MITCTGNQKKFSKADTAVPLELYLNGRFTAKDIDTLAIAESELEGLLVGSFGYEKTKFKESIQKFTPESHYTKVKKDAELKTRIKKYFKKLTDECNVFQKFYNTLNRFRIEEDKQFVIDMFSHLKIENHSQVTSVIDVFFDHT